MPSTNSEISSASLAYLNRFCAERAAQRAGKLHWDAFLVEAYRQAKPPTAVLLFDWLQENLEDATDLQELVEDFTRFGSLLLGVKRTESSSPVAPNFSSSRVDASTSELAQLNSHVLILGRRDSGKTSLMSQMVARDIAAADKAVVLIDSEGELVDQVKRWIHTQENSSELESRIVDISSTAANASAFTFNPLVLAAGDDMSVRASDIVSAFKAISSEPLGAQAQWNLQSASILRDSLLLLMGTGRSLEDLPILLAENDFRDVRLEQMERSPHQPLEFKTLLQSWQHYRKLSRGDQWINWCEPILNRVQPVLRSPLLSKILTGTENPLDLKEIILQRKILLINTDRFRDGALLGGLTVTALRSQSAALRAQHDRSHSVALYLDGIKNIVDSETIEGITERKKKLGIRLTAAERSLSELFPANIASRVARNFGKVAAFALDEEDAQILAPMFFAADEGASAGFATRLPDRMNVDSLIRQDSGTFLLHEQRSV